MRPERMAWEILKDRNISKRLECFKVFLGGCYFSECFFRNGVLDISLDLLSWRCEMIV